MISSAGSMASVETLAYVWARMMARYGLLWTKPHGTSPSPVDEAEWRDALRGLTQDCVAHGFAEDVLRAAEYPPSTPLFRSLCTNGWSRTREISRETNAERTARESFEGDLRRMV